MKGQMSAMASAEEQREQESSASGCVLHKTKTIQFFGRSSPIILQNDNGPCPLLAICNVLLLKNQLNLNQDVTEVSQEKLLSLVAERLIDSNSNVNNKDAGYVENQQQNIADAIDLLPRLTTGIDVNIKFRRIDDFEFTPECATFDLLDIPLCHGWLVDPQDHETAEAIGSKSYNTLMGDLVSLETRKPEDKGKDKDEDCIDFAAATAATLGVPSPSLSTAKSFDESPRSTSELSMVRKGDAEEEAEIVRVLKLSENESPTKGYDSGDAGKSREDMMMTFDEKLGLTKSPAVDPVHVPEGRSCSDSLNVDPPILDSGDVPGNCDRNLSSCEEAAKSLSLGDTEKRPIDQMISIQSVQSGECSLLNNVDLVQCIVDRPLKEAMPFLSLAKETVRDQEVESLSCPAADFAYELHKQNAEEKNGGENSTLIAGRADSEPSSGEIPNVEAIESFTSSLDGSEPIYEGEECILDSAKTVREDREPMYEGEVVLAKQADKGTRDVYDASQKDEITPRQGELIYNFLKGNASQLTFYGLFCLQEGLKERELCVFFRNNHFSTMFKFEGELYLLATDQGYMNQPDLVWEKLNEVNGDTLFMTSNFKEFRLESSSNGTWDEQNAVANTADYLASINSSVQAGSNTNSDLQLAIALQQQEFEQQPQRHAPQQPSGTGSSRLITGPQVSRSSGKATSSSSPKQDHKSKDKSNCKIM